MGSIFRKGSQQSGQSTGSSNDLNAASSQLIHEGEKLRTPAFSQLGQFLTGGRMPVALTGGIGTNEQELSSARHSIMAGGMRGGQLRTALAQLPLQRLQSRDAMRSGLFNTALGAGIGSFSAGAGGMANAAQNLNSLGQQRMMQNQNAKSGIGSGIGALMKGAKGMM